MQHLDEGTIHAWLDGELPSAEAEQIEAHTRECAECAQRVAEARGLIAASTRILTALDNVPSGVMPGAATPIAPARMRRWYDRTDLRAAAALLFVAGASLVALRVGRNTGTSLQTMAKTESSPVASAVILDSASPTTAEASKVAEARQAEPRRESRRMAASPPVMSSKIAPLTSKAVGSMRAMDEVSASKAAEAPAVAQSAAAASPLMRMNAGIAQRKAAANEPSPLAGAVGGIARPDAAFAQVSDTADGSLTVMKADSTATTRRVEYKTSQGVEITLVDSLTNVTDAKDLKTRDKAMAAPAPITAPTAVTTTMQSQSRVTAGRPPINSISWTDGDHHYTLRGPLTVRELEALKPRIIKMRR
jgi:hypothetical protein